MFRDQELPSRAHQYVDNRIIFLFHHADVLEFHLTVLPMVIRFHNFTATNSFPYYTFHFG